MRKEPKICPHTNRVIALAPATDWFAIGFDEDEARNTKEFWITPVACWASLAPHTSEEDLETFNPKYSDESPEGVIAMTSMRDRFQPGLIAKADDGSDQWDEYVHLLEMQGRITELYAEGWRIPKDVRLDFKRIGITLPE